MNPWLMSAVMVVAWSVFALQMMIKIGALKKMAPESRMDQIPRRIGLLFKIGIGQEKLVGRSENVCRESCMLIFWGAMLIGIREVTLMGEGLFMDSGNTFSAWLQLPQRFFIHLSLQHCRTRCFADDPSCALPAFCSSTGQA